MSARILDGKSIAEQIRSEVAAEVTTFRARTGVQPTLAAILVGDDPGSQVYVRNKERACEKAGMRSQLHRLPATTSEKELLGLLETLNGDPQVHGILVQLPLPRHIDTRKILDAVDPKKDVDAFAPENVGLISQGRPRFLPCTPHGVMQLLGRCGIEVAGKHAVVVGRSDIVGKPMAMMLAQRMDRWVPVTRTDGYYRSFANAQHGRANSTSRHLSRRNWEAKRHNRGYGETGAVVIDVGINRLGDGLVGDVDFHPVSEVASAITPVPAALGHSPLPCF